MQHEVLVDDLAVDQGLDIELLLEDGLDKAVLLSAPEALELSLAGVAKSYALVLVLQLYLQFLALSLLVQDVVAEVDQNHQLGVGLLRVLERLPGEVLVQVLLWLCLLHLLRLLQRRGAAAQCADDPCQ